MDVWEEDSHTQCRGDEERGSFNQMYNDTGASDKTWDGRCVFFMQSEQKGRAVRGRPELCDTVVQSLEQFSK